jgi:hypothetical protein
VDFKAEEGSMDRGDGHDEVHGLGEGPGTRWEHPAPAHPPAQHPGDWPDDGEGDDGDDRTERARRDPSQVRAEDTEPYVGLQYVARLFKVVAMVVIVALTAEIVAALVMEGPDALLPLFLELLQGAVLAAVLWGASDLTLLFIDVGHDVRAQRVLLGRMSARLGGGFDASEPPPPQVRRAPRPGDDDYRR